MTTPIQGMPTTPPLDSNGQWRREWLLWFNAMQRAVSALTTYGATTVRPVDQRFVGQPFFDQTLNDTVRWDGTQWVTSGGVSPGLVSQHDGMAIALESDAPEPIELRPQQVYQTVVQQPKQIVLEETTENTELLVQRVTQTVVSPGLLMALFEEGQDGEQGPPGAAAAAAASSSGYSTVQDEGVSLTQRTTIDFVGAGVTVTDTGSKTQVSISGGGGGSATVGTTTLDFGAFPGASDASVAVTGQAGILSGSSVFAWIFPAATTDHSADEHWIEPLKVSAGNIVAGTGFTVYGINTCEISEPLEEIKGRQNTTTGVLQAAQGPQRQFAGGKGTLLYGKFNVGWLWI